MITGKEKKPQVFIDIPGEMSKELISMDEKYIATTTKAAPVTVKNALGVVFEDIEGNIFFDFTSGVGVVNTGHCHPEIVKAIRAQAGKVMHFAGTDFYYDIQVKLAQELCRITPGTFEKKVYFGNSGTEVVEAAMKIARWSTQRKLFLSFLGAFHGRTMGALALTASKSLHKQRFFPWMPGAVHAPYPNPYRNPFGIDGYENPEELVNVVINYIEEMFKRYVPPDDVAAIVVESLQGEGGYIVPPQNFLKELRRLSDEHGIPLIDDEIQSGFGRTGKMFAIEHFKGEPDIITTAKGMGSGMPIGAAIFKSRYDFGVKGAHSTTFGGNLVACAASYATVKVLEKEKMVENAAIQGKYLHKRLKELEERYEIIGDARGLGLMQATEVVKNKKSKEPAPKLRDAIIERAYKKGVLLLSCGESAIRYIPPLCITREQIEAGLDIIEQAIKET
jgi:4-aminobutyrate aminotransferase